MSYAALQTIGRFTLLEPIGAGGLFESWRALDDNLGRPVFFKTQRANAELSREQREMIAGHCDFWKSFARCSFRYMPNVLAIGQHDERLFLATEFIAGEKLSEWLSCLPAPDLELTLLFAMCELAKALRELHAHQLVHGDISPANVLASNNGLWLVDPAPVTALVTPDGPSPAMRMMTPRYAAPEVTAGERYVPESDLYGLGAAIDRMRTQFGLAEGSKLHATAKELMNPVPALRRPAMDTLLQESVPPLALLSLTVLRSGNAQPAENFFDNLSEQTVLAESEDSMLATRLAPVGIPDESTQIRPVAPETFLPTPVGAAPPVSEPPRAMQRDEDASVSRECASILAGVPIPSETGSPASAEFMVTAPPAAPLGETFVVELWVAPSERSAEMRQLALKPGRMVERAGRPGLQLGARQIVTVALSLPGFEVDEAVQRLLWTGQIANLGFLVKAPSGTKPGLKAGRIKLLLGDLPIASILFDVNVAGPSEALPAGEVTVDVRRIGRAFASYASDDRPEVLRRVQGMRSVGVQVFMDIMQLRAGEEWEPALFREISRSDGFFLFWSDAARRSEWVQKEWRYALMQRGLEFINPVPLADPRDVPPPPELSAKHFNDVLLVFLAAQQSRAAAEPSSE